MQDIPDLPADDPAVTKAALQDIQSYLADHGQSLADFAPMPLPTEGAPVHQQLLEIPQLSGLPPHKLRLREGMPIMMLCSWNAARGLADGTCLIVKEVQRHVIDAVIASSSHVGKKALIPHITMTPSKGFFLMPFKLERCRFPVRLAIAMTINKAQGQILQLMGVFLPAHAFPHGQLFVAVVCRLSTASLCPCPGGAACA